MYYFWICTKDQQKHLYPLQENVTHTKVAARNSCLIYCNTAQVKKLLKHIFRVKERAMDYGGQLHISFVLKKISISHILQKPNY